MIEFFTETWWTGTIIGIIISIFFKEIVFALLPDKMKDSMKYWKRKLSKLIRPPKMKIELVAKTFSVSEKKLEITQTLDTLRKNLLSIGLSSSTDHNKLLVNVPIGKNSILSTIIAMPTLVDENEVIDAIECRFLADCSYRKFHNDIRELREAQMKIAPVLRAHISDFMGDISLICELKSLYALTGVLSEVKMGVLYSDSDDGKHFEFTKNKIILYDNNLNTEMLSFLQRIVTVYA